MSVKARVRKLLEVARGMARQRRREVHSRMCQGASWEELLRMVEEALPPGAEPVVQDLLAQMEEYHQRPPRELANGELRQDTHGFVLWLWSLESGSSSLPETIPLELLLAWRDGHRDHPAQASPVPLRRCEDCKLILPNSAPAGRGYFTTCPVCGSGNLSHKKLSGNAVDGWDPLWVYTPLPPPQRGANRGR